MSIIVNKVVKKGEKPAVKETTAEKKETKKK